jgi:hypothetical protein
MKLYALTDTSPCALSGSRKSIEPIRQHLFPIGNAAAQTSYIMYGSLVYHNEHAMWRSYQVCRGRQLGEIDKPTVPFRIVTCAKSYEVGWAGQKLSNTLRPGVDSWSMVMMMASSRRCPCSEYSIGKNRNRSAFTNMYNVHLTGARR